MRTVRAAARWPTREERFEDWAGSLIAVRGLLDALAGERSARPADAIVAEALASARVRVAADALALFSTCDETDRPAAEGVADGVHVLRGIVTADGALEPTPALYVAPDESPATAAATAAGVPASTAVEVALIAPDGARPLGWLVALYGGDDAARRATDAEAALVEVAWPFTLALRAGWQAVRDAGSAGGAWPGLTDADRELCALARHGVTGELEAAAPPAPGPAPAGSEPAPARPVDENVQFTVYRPRRIAPGIWSTVLAFAHLAERREGAAPDEPDPVAEVQRQARQALGDEAGAFGATTEDSGEAIPRAGDLTFALTLPGVEVNPPRRSFRWVEDVHREEFRIRAPAALDGQTVRGGLQVYLGALLVADVALAIRVDGAAARPAAADTEADRGRPYRRIFPSYSHRDEAIVRQVEAYARTMGDEYLRDVTHLRAGEAWDARLRDFIRDADVFQLFWSRNSMASQYVRQEWEYALSLGRSHFVRPTYWETPLPEAPERDLPPPALRALHFQRLPLQAEPADPVSVPPPPPAPPPSAPPPAPAARPRPAPPPAERPPARRARRFRLPTAIAALLLVGFLGGTLMFRQGLPPPSGSSQPEAPGGLPMTDPLRALSPDGQLIASMDGAGRIRVAAAGAPEPSGLVIATRFRPEEVERLRFSDDGSRIVCELKDGQIVEWDARTGARLAHWRSRTAICRALRPTRRGVHVRATA
jgi:hypothetical protein